jgi:hypothetical protein
VRAATTRLVDDSLATTRSIVFNPVVVPNPDRDEECDKEKDDVHDAQREARLEHSTGLVDMERQRIIETRTDFSERTKTKVETSCRGTEVRAIRMSDAS